MTEQSTILLALHHAEYLLRKEINHLTIDKTYSPTLDGVLDSVLDGWVECVKQQAMEIKRLNNELKGKV
jgi:hypothetical protein